MPNRWTFTIKPISVLLHEEINTGLWADAFAGKNSPAQITNDLNPERNTTFHLDALDFLKSQQTASVDGVLYDPPYSFHQASECYKSVGRERLTATVTNKKYWADVKNEIARIIKPSGKVICFGWNSNGLGLNRGFTLTRVLIIPHGGSMNDTICTVELKRLSTHKKRLKPHLSTY